MELATQSVVAEEALSDFLPSMPKHYARLFEHTEMLEHLRIVNERGQRTVHLGFCREGALPGIALCIVMDTRTGLLSLVGDVLLGQDLDVTMTHAFTRHTGSRQESLICVWARRITVSTLPTNVGQEDLRDISFALTELIEKQQAWDHTEQLRKSAIVLAPVAPRVYYDTQAMRSGEFVLVVQAPDCPGLLLAVTRALFRQGAEIVASEARTENGLAKDRFTLACGSRGTFTPDRLADIQQGTLSAIRRLIAQRIER